MSEFACMQQRRLLLQWRLRMQLPHCCRIAAAAAAAAAAHLL